MQKKQIYLIFLVLAALGAMAACSDNPTNSNENLFPGNLSITVTGDIESEKNGYAEYIPTMFFGEYRWNFSMYDLQPATFDLFLSKFGGETISQPEPGTYPIGHNPDPFELFFTAGFEYFIDGSFENTVTYNAFCCGDKNYVGTLVIESSTEKAIRGSFEFDAVFISETDDCDNTRTITVQGEFTADVFEDE